MSDDAELLQAYVKDGSEPAFRALVGRHIPLVLATARRIVAGDVHLAQDVTQTVFTDLARKAATLPPSVVLGGWLHRHTCFTAAKAVRTEQRRRARERTAMELNTVNDNAGQDAYWAQLAPVLDDALNNLNPDDRDALVLRYFEQRDLRAIGAALGVSDDTAQKRIARALDKLHAILTQRGITVSSVLLATALDTGAVTAPVSSGLTATITASALSGVAAAASTSFLTSILKIMTASKLALSAAALVVVVGTAFLLLRNTSSNLAVAEKNTAPTASPPASASASPAPQVETPKVAPAPARGSAPSTLEQTPAVAASGSLSFGGAQPGTLMTLSGTSGTNTYPAPLTAMQTSAGMNSSADPPADWETIITRKRESLERLKALFTHTIDEGTAQANGDPVALAKLEPVRQQLEYYTKQGEDNEALATDATARAAYLANMQSQFEETKVNFPKQLTQATAQANGDPAKLAQIETARQQFAILVQKQEKAFVALGANQPPASRPSVQSQIIATKIGQLEQFKVASQRLIDLAVAKANGDPAELAKAETARQQYENYIQEQQQAIDALKAQAAP